MTALTFGSASTAVADSLKGRAQDAWTGMVILIVLAVGVKTLQEQNPYREVEDIKSVLSYLEKSQGPNDPVYVYPGAEPALTFYGISGSRFIFGKHYPQVDRENYNDEIASAMGHGTGRLWIVLSHVSPWLEELIVSEMPRDWHIEKKVNATKASLYQAQRLTKQ